jgi:hypothetical protein
MGIERLKQTNTDVRPPRRSSAVNVLVDLSIGHLQDGILDS